ncbi:hypothetical protein DVA67_022940 [Solirubrobacter sp. CPCC 204708]|uniref:Uncharacterized protein n=1 Tax=Solirubrobacter deserti TaxID=2282478 RepID=A0ABT4RIB3_9ACTN|nr:hypothetical protein [Solirubrobacter deserti]MBE2318850.1 hypothetical protein [Solirubrobacter deserti]MDA0138230.1 hypothetical protein [Solirubrobacter deserti]
MNDFERALERELLAAARRRTAARRRRTPTLFLATALATGVAAFAGAPALVATDTSSSGAITAPPCSAQESLLGAGACTSNPFSSLTQ